MSATNLDRSTAGAAARIRHWTKPEDALVPVAEVGELSDEQRAGVIAFFAANPDGGYKAALHAVGIRATRPEAKALLHGDDELRAARFEPMGLGEGSLFKQLGRIASDIDNKDSFRAVMAGLNMLHGWSETASVEHTGAGGRTMGVTVEHDFSGILDGLERIGVLRRGAAAPDSTPLPVLPTRTDEAAVDRSRRASLPPA